MIRNKWIWGASRTSKYAVKDLTEVSIQEGHQFVDDKQVPVFQVIARKRAGHEKVLLKNFDFRIEAQKFLNETFPSR